MVLSLVRRWLRTLLRPSRNQCGGDFYVEKPIPGLPPQSPIDFVGRAPLTRPSSPNSNSDSALSGYGSASCLNSQSTPLLTILPPEIRCQIWKEVVGGHSFHLIVNQRRRLYGWRCEFAYPSACDQPGHRAYCRLTPPLSEAELMERKDILALLSTCRRIYSETVDLLYSSNSFIVYDSDVIYYLASMLLPQRINSIRSLRLEWGVASRSMGPSLDPQPDNTADVLEMDYVYLDQWVTIWHTIASLRGLQDLCVRLHVNRLFWGSLNMESAKTLLKPIREVTGPENFTLTLPFPAMDIEKPYPIYSSSAAEGWQDPWDELPCTIRRVYEH